MDAKFNRDAQQAMKNASSPLFRGSMICGEDLSISFMHKRQLHLKQSWALGFSILEISKYIMQSLYYDEILPKLGEGKVAVVLSDTDSFLLVCAARDEEEVMEKLEDVMDFSNLDPSHPLFSEAVKKVPGFLKNEYPKDIIVKVVALKSKTYSLKTEKREKSVNRAKGVKEKTKAEITIESYEGCLDQVQDFEVEQHSLRSIKHVNRLVKSRKIAFSSFDDKRYLMCARHSTPHGSRWARSHRGLMEASEAGTNPEDFCPLCTKTTTGLG